VKLLWVILLVIFASLIALAKGKPCRPARHAKIPAIKGFTYQRARKILLAAGWQPLQTKSSDKAETDPAISYGNGPLFWRSGYIELESCSGTGIAACAFLFKDKFGNRIRVTTEGEELPDEKVHAGVNSLRFVCDGSFLRRR
jgi:hypothetical protein